MSQWVHDVSNSRLWQYSRHKIMRMIVTCFLFGIHWKPTTVWVLAKIWKCELNKNLNQTKIMLEKCYSASLTSSDFHLRTLHPKTAEKSPYGIGRSEIGSTRDRRSHRYITCPQKNNFLNNMFFYNNSSPNFRLFSRILKESCSTFWGALKNYMKMFHDHPMLR